MFGQRSHIFSEATAASSNDEAVERVLVLDIFFISAVALVALANTAATTHSDTLNGRVLSK